MALFNSPAAQLADGIARAFRGARTGDQRALLTGAALGAWGLWRRSSVKKKELVYRRTIPEGSSLVIRYGKGDLPEVEVKKVDQRTR